MAHIVKLNGSLHEAWRLLETQKPDALISHDSPETLSLYQNICEKLSPAERPLLVLIQDQKAVSDQSQPSPADVILPDVSLTDVEKHIQLILELRLANAELTQSNAALAAANSALIEENKMLKAQLEQDKRLSDELTLLKNAIVRNVSHELKTPLLHVKAAIALLAEDGGKTQNLIEYASTATARLEGGIRSVSLLNELLNGSMELHAQDPVMVAEAIEYALRNLRRSWEHKDHIDRVLCQLETDLPPVQADRQGLGIVLQLLIDNALKFSEKTVEVSATKRDGRVYIRIEDHGIGIPSDKVGKIFDVFYQAESSSTRRFGGMGIGLAIVRFILERHQTQITVESRENQGSTFSFSLPVAHIG
jgi:signal transduction histidine kinase